jgi:hypothetical protein
MPALLDSAFCGAEVEIVNVVPKTRVGRQITSCERGAHPSKLGQGSAWPLHVLR